MKIKVWILALIVLMSLNASGAGEKKGPRQSVGKTQSATKKNSTAKKPQKPNPQRQNSLRAYANQRNDPAALSTSQSAPSRAAQQGRTRSQSDAERESTAKFFEALSKEESRQKGPSFSSTGLNNRRTSFAAGDRQGDSQKIINRALASAKPLPPKDSPERKVELQKRALKNVFGKGISVIGRKRQSGRHENDYMAEAKEIGHSFFHIEDKDWEDLSPEERDYANMHFIDSRAAGRDVFLSSTPRAEIERKPEGQLYREVTRLIEVHKYNWSADGNRLVPPKGNDH